MSTHNGYRSPDVPAARVIREGSRRAPRPTLRDGLREWFTLSDAGRDRLALIAGLWPLLLVAGMAVALLWSAGYHSVQP